MDRNGAEWRNKRRDEGEEEEEDKKEQEERKEQEEEEEEKHHGTRKLRGKNWLLAPHPWDVPGRTTLVSFLFALPSRGDAPSLPLSVCCLSVCVPFAAPVTSALVCFRYRAENNCHDRFKSHGIYLFSVHLYIHLLFPCLLDCLHYKGL